MHPKHTSGMAGDHVWLTVVAHCAGRGADCTAVGLHPACLHSVCLRCMFWLACLWHARHKLESFSIVIEQLLLHFDVFMLLLALEA